MEYLKIMVRKHMNLKKIMLFNLVAWFCVSQSTDMFYSINYGLKNNASEIDNIVKIAVLWSGFLLFNKLIKFTLQTKRNPNETTGGLIYGLKELLCADGLTMIAKTTLMTYAAWNLKDYPNQK